MSTPPAPPQPTAPTLSYWTIQPDKWTFQCTKLRSWVEAHLQGRVLNACAGPTHLDHEGPIVRNDIDPSVDADYHVDVATLDDDLSPATVESPAELVADDESETVQLTLSPLTAALTTVMVEVGDFETRERAIVVAIRRHLERLLRDPTVEIDAPPDELAVRSDGSLQGALETVADRTDDYGNLSELLEAAIARTVGSGSETTMSVPDLVPYLPLIDAVVERDQQSLSSRQEVVPVAVRRQLAAL